MEDEQTLLERRAEQLEIIRQFRLIDDTFMTKVFEDKECAELLLSVILDRDDLTVVKVTSQLEIKNLQGRSSRLDIFAIDEQGKQYDVEVQRADDGANPKRARYNSSLLDANSLKSGEEPNKLPENYVIFITEHDVLKGGKPIYTINRTVEEMDKSIFDDGSHIIYVNGEIRDESKLGKLMQDFFCADPKKMHNKALHDRTKYFKETERGADTMCKLMEDYAIKYSKNAVTKAVEKAEKRTAKEQSKKFAVRLWNNGIKDFKQISEMTELSLDEVKKLFEGKTA